MIRYLIENYPIEILTTPNQDLIFGNIPEDLKEKFAQDMETFGYGLRNGKEYSTLRMLSGACVGRDTCRLAYTDSEKFEPYLIDLLEQKWGNVAESIGVTGCEKQCFRQATKTIGWVGSGFNMYMLKLGGTEDARHQGGPLIDPGTQEIYLKNVPRKEVATVTDALFEFYFSSRLPEEERAGTMGYFFKSDNRLPEEESEKRAVNGKDCKESSRVGRSESGQSELGDRGKKKEGASCPESELNA
jgi:sulfite reductase beta subunit-like hemoprotein